MKPLFTLPNRLRIIYLFAYACAVCWVPVLALYYKKAGLTGLQIGILGSIPPAVLLMVQPFWGLLADRTGRKKLLLVVMILSSAVFLLFPEKGSFAYLFILTLALGIFWSTVHPLIDCITLDMVANRDERAFSFFRVWGSIGWSAGSLLMTYFDLSDNLIFNFRLASFFLMVSLLLIAGLRPAKVSAEASDLDFSLTNIKLVLGNARLISFLIIVLFIAILTAPIWYYTSILYSDNGASSSWISLVFGFQGLCEIPLFFMANKLIKRYGLYKMLLFAFYTNALRSFLYAVVPSPHYAILIELLQGISWSLLWVCCVEYVNELVAPQWRATGQSLLWAVFFGAGTIIGNIWTGYLYGLMPIKRIFLINSFSLTIFSLLVSIYVTRNALSQKIKTS